MIPSQSSHPYLGVSTTRLTTVARPRSAPKQGRCALGAYPAGMSEMPVPEAQDHLSEVAHQAAAGRVVYLTEGGQRIAAIVPAELAAAAAGRSGQDDISEHIEEILRNEVGR